jgi:hypothetical protein
MLSTLPTLKARLAIPDIDIQYDTLLTTALTATSARFDRQSTAPSPAPSTQPTSFPPGTPKSPRSATPSNPFRNSNSKPRTPKAGSSKPASITSPAAPASSPCSPRSQPSALRSQPPEVPLQGQLARFKWRLPFRGWSQKPSHNAPVTTLK